MNYKYFSEIYTGENEFLREKMQFLFDKSFREKDEQLLRSQYVALRQLQFNDNLKFSPECIELSALAESVTVACDILATESDVSFIYCGDGPCYIQGSYKLIAKALLNLLSNGYLHGKEKLITVKTVDADNFSRLEVLSGGMFTENNHKGKGLLFVRDVCKKMNGKFFIEQSISHTKAVMVFEKATHLSDSTAHSDYSDILSLVNDRLSPACVEMFGMEYH